MIGVLADLVMSVVLGFGFCGWSAPESVQPGKGVTRVSLVAAPSQTCKPRISPGQRHNRSRVVGKIDENLMGGV